MWRIPSPRTTNGSSPLLTKMILPSRCRFEPPPARPSSTAGGGTARPPSKVEVLPPPWCSSSAGWAAPQDRSRRTGSETGYLGRILREEPWWERRSLRGGAEGGSEGGTSPEWTAPPGSCRIPGAAEGGAGVRRSSLGPCAWTRRRPGACWPSAARRGRSGGRWRSSRSGSCRSGSSWSATAGTGCWRGWASCRRAPRLPPCPRAGRAASRGHCSSGAGRRAPGGRSSYDSWVSISFFVFRESREVCKFPANEKKYASWAESYLDCPMKYKRQRRDGWRKRFRIKELKIICIFLSTTIMQKIYWWNGVFLWMKEFCTMETIEPRNQEAPWRQTWCRESLSTKSYLLFCGFEVRLLPGRVFVRLIVFHFVHGRMSWVIWR